MLDILFAVNKGLADRKFRVVISLRGLNKTGGRIYIVNLNKLNFPNVVLCTVRTTNY